MDLVYITIDINNGKVKLNIGIIEYSKEVNILGTWIGKSNKKAQADYKKQISRTDGFFLWDDSKWNVARNNGYFAFINGTLDTPIMYVYKILKIYTPQERLKEWSSNGYTEEQYDTSTRRAFLCSSKCLKEINWSTYAREVGYAGSHLQCTQSLRNSSLFNF